MTQAAAIAVTRSNKKKFLGFIFKLLGLLVFKLIRFTLRFEQVTPGALQSARGDRNGPIIIASWHQNTVLAMMSHGKQNFCVMISRSFDGDIIAYITQKFHMYTARGSSSRGGKAAYSEMLEHVRAGGNGALTVDGPRGPLKKVKAGVIKLAMQTSAPIVPTISIADKYWELPKSWDKFRIPKPFAKVKVIYGQPLRVPATATNFEPYTQALEKSLLKIDKSFDKI